MPLNIASVKYRFLRLNIMLKWGMNAQMGVLTLVGVSRRSHVAVAVVEPL